MLTDEELAKALELIDDRYQRVVKKYLEKVGETIKKIGQLNQSSVNLLVQLHRMGVSSQQITRELQRVTKLTKRDIKALYKRAAQEENSDAKLSYIVRGIEPDTIRWDSLAKTIWQQTAGNLDNLSQTTIIEEAYREAVSDAVLAVNMGATDYNSAIRDTIKRIGKAGLQVEYESGYHRRLDTAVRQNVLDGVRQVQQKAQELIGEEIGADGVDITAHPNSAPDHEPVQGRRFDKGNFNRMQSGLDFEDVDGNHYDGFERPITQWRCRHLVHYIILGVSRRMYSNDKLEEWKQKNAKGCTIDGKHYTNYEATQLMRKLEAEIRRQKDTAILAKASGDDILRRECQSNISKLTQKYKNVAEAAKMRTRFEKTRVEGFEPTPEDTARFQDSVSIIPPFKGDAITHRSLHNNLAKSVVGKETIDYVTSGECNVEINYTDEAPKGVRGVTLGKSITIYAKNTRSIKLTAKTLVHEVTHCKYDIGGSQYAEALCFAREHLHEYGQLTYSDIRNIIKEVKALYPEYQWRKGGRNKWKK